MKEVVHPHALGFDVLLGPNNPQTAQGIRPEDIYDVLVAVKRYYDLVIVDAGNALTDVSVTLLDSADRILIIANPDLASLRDISRFLQISHALGYPEEKVLVVLNRMGVNGGVRQKDIERVLQHPLFAEIPEDTAAVFGSINRGLPILFRYPKKPIGRALSDLSKRLLDMQVTEEVSSNLHTLDKNKREVLLASSRLG
jgi:pilus assembly protein CpaE